MRGSYDELFEAIDVGPKRLKNRFYQVAHPTGLARYPRSAAAHLAVRAMGEWAVVSVDPCSIHPESDHTPIHEGRIWSRSDVDNLRFQCDEIHKSGALANIELVFGGSFGTSMQTRAASRGVSQIPDDRVFYHSCFEMGVAEILDLQEWYVDAALRSRAAGFDIVTINGAGGATVPHQFLMTFYNKRTDSYGGSFENRSRFFYELLVQVREAVGEQCAVAAAFGFDTLDGEISAENDGTAFIERCDDLVDLWDLRVGRTKSYGPVSSDIESGRFHVGGWQVGLIDKVRSVTTKPVVCLGRYTSADMMAKARSEHGIDLIGGARIAISDPFMPRKMQDGRVSEVVSCTGCNVCVSRFLNRAGTACPQNASAGEEYRRGWLPHDFSVAPNAGQKVLIVGAGLSALECACVLGERRMAKIMIVDARNAVGGRLNEMSKLPGLSGWADLIEARRMRMERLDNVEVVLDTVMTAGSIRQSGADIVILATGSRWAEDGMNGASHETIPGVDTTRPNCLTPDQMVSEGKAVPGQRVLIYDADGYYIGFAIAQQLAEQGKDVIYVTPLEAADNYSVETEESADVMRTLISSGVDVHTSKHVTGIDGTRITGCELLSMRRTYEWEADSVVLVTQRIKESRLYEELLSDPEALEAAGIAEVLRLGDCVAPRLIEDLVFEGHRLGREIESADPMSHKQFLREHRQLGVAEDEYGVLPGTAVS